MPTWYGEASWLEATPQPINIAFTETAFTFHVDLPYYDSPPGILCLHCVERSQCVEGGETLLVDSLACAEILREKHPEHFRALCEIPATFRQHANGHFTIRCTHIKLDADGFTPLAVIWSPPFKGVLRASVEDAKRYYSAYRAFADIINDLETAAEFRYRFVLRPGDTVVLNNRQWLHARTAFSLNGGRRRLRVAYVSAEHFASRFNSLIIKRTGRDDLL